MFLGSPGGGVVKDTLCDIEYITKRRLYGRLCWAVFRPFHVAYVKFVIFPHSRAFLGPLMLLDVLLVNFAFML